MTRQSGTEWSKSCHMFHVPSALPARHSAHRRSDSFSLLTSLALLLMTPVIGLDHLSHTAIAGNQSRGETSIDSLSTCAAKHLAFVIHHDSPDIFPDVTMSESISFSASAPTPVVGSVTSCRNLRLRYVSASAISATYGSFHVVSHQIRCFAGAASSACVLSPVAAPSATGAIATAATTRIFAIRMYCLIYRLQVSQRHRREASFCRRALCGRRL